EVAVLPGTQRPDLDARRHEVRAPKNLVEQLQIERWLRARLGLERGADRLVEVECAFARCVRVQLAQRVPKRLFTGGAVAVEHGLRDAARQPGEDRLEAADDVLEEADPAPQRGVHVRL